MSTLAQRLKQARTESGLTQVELAKEIGVSQNTIQKVEKGGETKYINQLARALKVNAEWLQFGTGEQHPTPRKIESNVGELGGFNLWNRETPLDDDEYEVPFLKDIEMAAGDGMFDQIEDYNGFKLRFSKATLRRQGVQYENAVCVTASGDSMEPVIPDGTTIGIDLGYKTIRDGKIYAINHGGLLRVKILSRLPNDYVMIRSYNDEEYPDETVHLSEVQVIGRVFWWSVLV